MIATSTASIGRRESRERSPTRSPTAVVATAAVMRVTAKVGTGSPADQAGQPGYEKQPANRGGHPRIEGDALSEAAGGPVRAAAPEGAGRCLGDAVCRASSSDRGARLGTSQRNDRCRRPPRSIALTYLAPPRVTLLGFFGQSLGPPCQSLGPPFG